MQNTKGLFIENDSIKTLKPLVYLPNYHLFCRHKTIGIVLQRLLISLILLMIGISMSAQHINGITAVATPSPFPSDPYPRLKETNANWICLVPYGFTRLNQTKIWYNVDRQWWGEKPEGVIENIRLAKNNGLKVFMKPQIYVPGSWPGDIDFKSEAEWVAWETAYRDFIMSYLDIAISHDVDMFCVGTEFKTSEKKRPEFWKQLISDMRCLYPGKLTYSSNWDSYEGVPFWSDLDYIGISSYFPLSSEATPVAERLSKKWKSNVSSLRRFSEKKGKKMLFTEYGYLSVDGCAGKTWELEKKVHDLPINEAAQAVSFNELYSALWHESFWAGGFIWKWFPHGQGHEGYVDRDYTPQDKKAEKVIANWFGKDLQ